MRLEIALTKKQIEFDKAIDRYPVVLYGGARGSGKSFSLRAIMLKRRFKYANSIGYIFRRNYSELEANHISPLFAQFPELRKFYNQGKKTLTLPNGSELRFAYCDHEGDLAKFQGREVHDLGIEEVGDWPERFFEFLRASNRSSNPKIPARTILTGNPGGLGHQWIKRLFISRDFRETENPNDYFYVPAKVYDNPALMKADPMYVKRLESIKSDTLRRAWLDGDWDITAGVYFADLRREVHFIEPFKIPAHWKWFGAYDYGFNHPCCWQWWVSDEDGNCYLVREMVKAKMSIPEQAVFVAETEKEFVKLGVKQNTATIFEAGHDCWAKKKASDPTIFEDFMREFNRLGIKCVLRQANINRKLGASQLRERIRVFEKGGKKSTQLYVFNTCPITWDCLTRMIHDPTDVEDVLKVDAVDGDPYTGDEGYDTARMAIASRPPIAKKIEKPTLDRYKKRQSQTDNWKVI
jgi:phage terminase large subunit